MSSALIFWYVSKRMKEGMFPFLCIIFGNIFGAAAITLFQGVDIVYVTVRLVGGFIVACLVYQYFVKKIK